MTAVKKAESIEKKAAERTFSKEQILASERYANRRDLIAALLEENKSYTFQTVDEMIAKYQKGQVK